MLSRANRTIKVASTTELMSRPYYLRMWLAARNLRMPRRAVLNAISDSFLSDDFYVIYPSGEPYPIPDIDEVFGNDPDMRWLSVFLLADITGENPRHFSRKIERLRLLDLYFRIVHPDIARHFGQ